VRAFLGLLAISLVVSVASASGQQLPASSYGEAVFLISGRGWGHGVGMSQYGAYGQALAGRSHQQILAYYYPGTTIGKTGRQTVRVLLAEGRRAVSIASTAPLLATDATGAKYRLPKTVTLHPDLLLPVEAGPVTAATPLVVGPSKKALVALDGKQYRGKLELVPQGQFLRVVNIVPLESYVQGVVAGEMPFRWPAEALEAQAVAARSYALANLLKGKPYDLYSDPRSQVYLGVAGEKASTTQAVTATAGDVVLYGGRIATTYYFSTSGGKTASALDVFGFSVPYLVSRPDPWDTASPYHQWGPVLLGARTVQSKLGLDARVLDATGAATPSGRIRELDVTTTSGNEPVPASLVRTALGLRSTWITVGVLRLDRPPAGPLLYGTTAHLAGIGRALGSPRLASSPDGASWTRVASASPNATGAVAFDVKPAQITRYRLEADEGVSPALLVDVAPLLKLSAPSLAAPTVLFGTMRPRTPGVAVVVERRKGNAWVSVGGAATDASGAFKVAFAGPVPTGSYRARASASATLAAATSDVLQVTG
jgi:stage II sporulation protein D